MPDILITLNHFKAHEATGIGGALKNIGMGCGSRAGKMEMHSSGKPAVDREACVSCGACRKNCDAHGGGHLVCGEKLKSTTRSAWAAAAVWACARRMRFSPPDEANDILNKKIAEYTLAVVAGGPISTSAWWPAYPLIVIATRKTHIPIVPDVGMFASFDPVALDVACADAVNRQPICEGSALSQVEHCGVISRRSIPTNWRTTIEHAVRLGLGKRSI